MVQAQNAAATEAKWRIYCNRRRKNGSVKGETPSDVKFSWKMKADSNEKHEWTTKELLFQMFSPAVHDYGAIPRLLLLSLHSGNNVNHPSTLGRYSDLGPPVKVEVPDVL